RGLSEAHPPAVDGVRYATPILATDLAELLEKAFELNLHGLYHITGAERTNAHRFVNELAAALGLDGMRLTTAPPGAQASADACETSLNTRQARRDLAHAMPLLREGLERFAAQAVNGYVDRLRAGTRSTTAVRAA